MKSLLIIGAGEFGQVVRELARSIGYEKVAFLDDNSEMAVGPVCSYADYSDEYDEFIIAIGNPKVRGELFPKLALKYQAATLVSPKAYVSMSASLGEGTIVEPMAVVNSGATIGTACIINAGAVVNHNSVIGDFCQIDCNAVVSADVTVSDGTKIKAGTAVFR